MATPWTQRPTFPLRPPSHPPPSLRLHARPRSFTVRPRTHREVRRALPALVSAQPVSMLFQPQTINSSYAPLQPKTKRSPQFYMRSPRNAIVTPRADWAAGGLEQERIVGSDILAVNKKVSAPLPTMPMAPPSTPVVPSRAVPPPPPHRPFAWRPLCAAPVTGVAINDSISCGATRAGPAAASTSAVSSTVSTPRPLPPPRKLSPRMALPPAPILAVGFAPPDPHPHPPPPRAPPPPPPREPPPPPTSASAALSPHPPLTTLLEASRWHDRPWTGQEPDSPLDETHGHLHLFSTAWVDPTLPHPAWQCNADMPHGHAIHGREYQFMVQGAPSPRSQRRRLRPSRGGGGKDKG